MRGQADQGVQDKLVIVFSLQYYCFLRFNDSSLISRTFPVCPLSCSYSELVRSEPSVVFTEAEWKRRLMQLVRGEPA